jgi:hypothetical protein
MKSETKSNLGDQPAFPSPTSFIGPAGATSWNGVTTRLWLAAHAMNGLLASLAHKYPGISQAEAAPMIAQSSLVYADAMLAEIEKGKE